jgi:hypothetical protein
VGASLSDCLTGADRLDRRHHQPRRPRGSTLPQGIVFPQRRLTAAIEPAHVSVVRSKADRDD